MELTRENFYVMFYYDFRRGLSRQECMDQLISTFGDEAPSYATVKRWYNQFNRGRHSLTNQFRKDRPKSVVGPAKTDNARSSIRPFFISNHFYSLLGSKYKYCLSYLLQNIIFRNRLLFIPNSVEHNVEEQNIKVDNLHNLLNCETGAYIPYILHLKIIHSVLLNMSFITTV